MSNNLMLQPVEPSELLAVQGGSFIRVLELAVKLYTIVTGGGSEGGKDGSGSTDTGSDKATATVSGGSCTCTCTQ